MLLLCAVLSIQRGPFVLLSHLGSKELPTSSQNIHFQVTFEGSLYYKNTELLIPLLLSD